MVHMPRRVAAVSAEVAALLFAGVVVAVPALRRRLRESSGQAREESNQGDSFLAAGKVPELDSTASASGQADDGHLDSEALADDPGQRSEERPCRERV